MSVNQDILDAAIRHAIYSERFGRGLARRIFSLLDDADADITAKLRDRLNRITGGDETGIATTRRLGEVLTAIRTINDKVYKRIANNLEVELRDMAEHEILSEQELFGRTIPVNFTAKAPTPELLKTLVTTTPIDGVLLASWVDDMSVKQMRLVERQLRIGILQGETVDQLVRRVRGTRKNRYKDGILNKSRFSTESLCITAVSTIANKARHTVYEDNAALIKCLKWVATLDSRTSPTCQVRDGKLYQLDQPHPTPPAHIRCRSLLIAVTKPFSELGLDAEDYTPKQRASMDGQVPASQTFGDWLKNQSPERVAEVMGKTRADMFLSGKLKFSEFFSTDDQYYTLEELKKKRK